MNRPLPPQEELATELGQVLGRVYAFLRRAVLPSGMSRSQALLLGTLRDHGPQRVTDLARVEGIRQPTCTALVNALEDEGLVARRPDASDGRAVVVELTRRGRALLAEIVETRSRVLERYLARLAPSERRALAAAMPALAKLSEPVGDGTPAPTGVLTP